MASSAIYRNLLLQKRHGLPFWMPEPDANLPEAYRERGLSIGDLGLLTDDGGFDYLFNIHATADDPVNQYFGTPEDFSPLPLDPDHDIRKIELFHGEGACITHGVASRQSVTLGASAEVVPTTGVGLEVEFTVAEERAAMLVLPHDAVRYDAKKYPEYQGYALQQAESWYRYVNQTQRRGARNGSLYLVTGCDKGRSWGLAAVSQAQENSVMIKFTAGSLAQGTIGFHASWSRAGGVESRKHPPSSMDITQWENQCVFARGFVIGLRDNFLKRKFAGTVRMERIDSEINVLPL